MVFVIIPHTALPLHPPLAREASTPDARLHPPCVPSVNQRTHFQVGHTNVQELVTFSALRIGILASVWAPSFSTRKPCRADRPRGVRECPVAQPGVPREEGGCLAGTLTKGGAPCLANAMPGVMKWRETRENNKRRGKTMSKFASALSAVTFASLLLVGESPTEAQTDLSTKIVTSPGRSSRSVAINGLSAAAQAALTEGAEILSLPTFTDSFTTDGVTYPFTIVGSSPSAGGTTLIQTDLIPLEFVFFDATDFFMRDANGDVLVLGPSPEIIRRTVESPLFRNAPYTIDTTQFTDAIQQASFFPLKGKPCHDLLYISGDFRRLYPVGTT